MILEISLFYIFQIAIGHHVEFLKHQILYDDEVGRIEAHHHANFLETAVHLGDHIALNPNFGGVNRHFPATRVKY